MSTRKLLLTLLLTMLSATFSFAQIYITSNDIPDPGFTYTKGATSNPVTFDVGSGGSNQTYTFDSYAWDGTALHNITTPGSTPYAADFPTATRVDHGQPTDDPGSGLFTFMREANNAMYILGMVNFADDSVIHFDQETLMNPFPFTYQTNWISVTRTTVEIFPGFNLVMTDSAIVSADGWGTMQTPYITAAVLRVFSHHWLSTQVTGMPPITNEYLSYSWVNQQGLPMVTATSELDETDPNFATGLVEMMGVPLPADPIRGPVASSFSLGQNYPNPFNPSTTLPLSLDRTAQVTVEIYDETGRLVLNENLTLPAGQHELPINGSNWSTGTYFARISTGNQTQTTKMLLLK